MGFTQNTNFGENFFAESVSAEKRGTTVSLRDMYGFKMARTVVHDTKIHDKNFHKMDGKLQ